MSILWTIIASFLYIEIIIVLLLLLPFISPSRWSRIFKSRFLYALQRQATFYFGGFIIILSLYFLDAIREMNKYSSEMEDVNKHDAHVSSSLQIHMKLFRAQRNFYIAGFSLFLWLVLHRLVTLISSQAALMATTTASLRQAQSASETAKQLLDEKNKIHATGESADNEGNAVRESHEKEVKLLKQKLDASEEELRRAKLDSDVMKKQSESLTKEYDRLLKEHDKLQSQLSSSGNKKDE